MHELPAGEPFDAATSLLVSQFITDRVRRTAFYGEIARRLHPDGLLVTADLTTAPAGQHEGLLAVWAQMMRHIGATEAQIRAMLAAYGRDVALLPAPVFEGLLVEAGFVQPVRFLQSLLIHAWYAGVRRGFDRSATVDDPEPPPP